MEGRLDVYVSISVFRSMEMATQLAADRSYICFEAVMRVFQLLLDRFTVRGGALTDESAQGCIGFGCGLGCCVLYRSTWIPQG